MKYLETITTSIFKRRYWIIFITILFGIYLVNSQHTNFPDEFDNIVGGRYINEGILPYVGFFSHHNPGAYFIASLITFFTGQSFVSFRIVWAIVLFITGLIGFYLLNKKLPGKFIQFYPFYLILWAISATYYWGHMLLSETVVGYLLVPIYALVLIKTIKNIPVNLKDLALISIVSTLALLTSLTFVFSIGILICYSLFLFSKTHSIRGNSIKILLLFAVPYLFFFLYLVLTKSLNEFYFQSILFNRDYYIYNFPIVAGQVSTSPLRYALSILYNTSIQFCSLLVQLDHVNFSSPINMLLLLSNLVLIIYLTTKRKFMLAMCTYVFVAFLNARSEPLNSQETDFHSTVYAMVSLLNGIYVVIELAKDIRIKNEIHSYLYKGLLLLLGVYLFFGSLFLARGFSEKAYTKFMGQAPGIYDAPVVAPIINKIVSKNDFFWIGPFEFQELLYINGNLPSKYHWFLPASSRSEKIVTEIISDLTHNRPKLVVFKEDYSAFGIPPGDFNQVIVGFLHKNYFRLKDLNNDDKKYVPTITNLHNFDIAENFYFDNNRKNEIIKILLDNNIVKVQ